MFEDVEIIVNSLAVPVEVYFEPWGMNHALGPGESFRVVAVSEQEGKLEVTRRESLIAVYGWPGSTMRVYRDDVLVDDFSLKFPDLPPGLSTRSFIDLMFGGAGGPKPVQHAIPE